MSRAVLFVGPVGCGKSTAAGVAGDFGWDTYSMGDVAREVYEDYDGDLSLSEWAGERKREDAAWCAKELVGRLSDDGESLADFRDATNRVAVEGVRAIEEIDIIKQAFQTVEVAWVWCPWFTRVERRLDERGRERTVEEMSERDYREWKWGIREIVEGKQYDWWVDNTGNLDDLREQVKSICLDKQGTPLAPWHRFERSCAVLRNQGFREEILKCLSTHRYDRICPQEVADTVGCTNETARKHLEQLAEENTIRRVSNFNSVTFYEVADVMALDRREGRGSTSD